MVQNKTDKHPKLIRLPEVKRRTGFGKTWIYTLIFPFFIQQERVNFLSK